MRRHLFGTGFRATVAARRRARRPRLEGVERRVLLSTFTVSNTADDGEGSLRWAIVQANADIDADEPTRIDFDIDGDGDGEATIRLTAALEPLLRPVVIDARSQPGYDGRPLIRLDGSSLSAGESGLVIAGGESLIAGLSITGFPGAGIALMGGDGNLVESCFVGVDLSGGRAAANGEGVVILGSSHNTIGGEAASAGNLISGNAGAGVRIASDGGETLGNLVLGNRIGTDFGGSAAIGNQAGGVVIAGGRGGRIAGNAISGNRGAGLLLTGGAAENLIVGNVIGLTADGLHRLGNLGDGVLLDSAPGNQIGGLSTAEANQISANLGSGVRARGESAGLVVQGNQIGTDASGTLALGNAGDGVTLATSQNMIGGESAGAGNLIAHNGVGSVGAGIRLVGQVVGNTFLSNSIHDNASLGINLGDGPTPNHNQGDEPGPGPNDWLNYPILSSAVVDGAAARVEGTYFGAPSQTYLLQFFWSDRRDPSGFGEGQRHLGSRTVVTDSTGQAAFTISAPLEAGGGYVSATATDQRGNTSEFARSILAVPGVDLAVSMTATPGKAAAGAPLTFSMVVTNHGNFDAGAVVLNAQFPATATVVSASTARGEVAIGAGGTVTARIAVLGPGESVAFNVVVQPSADFVGEFVGSVRATMNEVDPRPDDNEARASVLIEPPAEPVKLSLKVDPPAVVHERSAFEYALTVGNSSSRTAADVALTAPLPPGVEFVSASTSWGAVPVFESGRVVATMDGLAPGEFATLSIVARPNCAAGAVLELSGGATSPDVDPGADGGSATATAKVLPSVGLMVKLRPQVGSIPLGGATYWIADVWNSGPSMASGVVLRLPTPGPDGFLATTATQGTIQTTAEGMTVFFGSIASGAYATVAALLSPGAAGPVSLVATVTADQHELYPVNTVSKATLSVFDWPGSIQFGQPSSVVPETAGVAMIPVERSGGALGVVSVRYQTVGGAAIPGVDYQPISGVLTFAPGERLKYLAVPILANPHGRGDAAVGLLLDSATGGAVLGERTAAQLTIHDLDPDFVPPTVAAVRLGGGSTAITSITITFDEPLDPGSALNESSYQLVDLGPGGIPGAADNQPLGLYPPSYDPTTRTVTLTPIAPLAADRNYAIALAGAGPRALVDLAGNRLAGDSNGVGGVDYLSLFTRGASLSYADSKGNLVSLRATGGGFLDLTRAPAGDARVLTLREGVPGWTTLSGSVAAQRGRGDGVTTIDAIDGLGQFGQIRVTLTSPPFVVKQLPFNLTMGRPLPVTRPAPRPPIRRPPPIVVRPAPVRQAVVASRVPAAGLFSAMRRGR